MNGAWMVRVLTLFPEMFPGPLGFSLSGQALQRGIWRLETLDIRSFARDKHRCVDDAPFGGGPGMVMRPDVIGEALEAVQVGDSASRLIYLSPRGRRLDQALVRDLVAGSGVSLLCGRFEGIDQRVLDHYPVEEVSLGDFVLSGGEAAAIALIDACVRLLANVMGDAASLEEESFERGLLEYPHYTRPQQWEGHEVPEVLLSGHHEKIRQWRRVEAERTTRNRRPDLWRKYQGRYGSDELEFDAADRRRQQE